MVEFENADLRGSRFSNVHLGGARFQHVDLSEAEVSGALMRGVRLRGCELIGVEITGDVNGLTVNGVEVGAYVEAELDRRHPERRLMRPADAEGFRTAWETLERLWDGTLERARRLPPERLHESVGGEWSFIETLRHLLFATDAWVRRAVLGDPAPWHPLDLPWDQMPDAPGVPRDREVRPSLDEVLAVRRDRAAGVRELIWAQTDESLGRRTEPVKGPGWPEPHAFEVRECLSVVVNEEWEHRLYAERDLAALEGAAPST
ncbi:DinB family protein [Dactylosporangium salmoneum]|uniref:DinB family protein n=1 Tax=Dactylosporangium salmoneum TaxID=53361 RepID=A0ABN3HTZ5_9ACTN